MPESPSAHTHTGCGIVQVSNFLPSLAAVKACHAVGDLHPGVTQNVHGCLSTHSQETLILPIAKQEVNNSFFPQVPGQLFSRQLQRILVIIDVVS